MIFLLSDSILNQQCAALLATQLHTNDIKIYPEISFSKTSQSDSLIIFDIDTQFSLASHFTAKKFADYLVQAGLPQEISNIYLIMQDMNADESLIAFSHQLARCFAQFHRRKMAVHVPCVLSYDMTLLFPAATSSAWEVYGINRNDVQAKKLIWKGEDLIHYMNDSQHTYDGISHVWPK